MLSNEILRLKSTFYFSSLYILLLTSYLLYAILFRPAYSSWCLYSQWFSCQPHPHPQSTSGVKYFCTISFSEFWTDLFNLFMWVDCSLSAFHIWIYILTLNSQVYSSLFCMPISSTEPQYLTFSHYPTPRLNSQLPGN